MHLPAGAYWNTNDGDFVEFASYYHIPVLSLKAAAYQLMIQGT